MTNNSRTLRHHGAATSPALLTRGPKLSGTPPLNHNVSLSHFSLNSTIHFDFIQQTQNTNSSFSLLLFFSVGLDQVDDFQSISKGVCHRFLRTVKSRTFYSIASKFLLIKVLINRMKLIKQVMSYEIKNFLGLMCYCGSLMKMYVRCLIICFTGSSTNLTVVCDSLA